MATISDVHALLHQLLPPTCSLDLSESSVSFSYEGKTAKCQLVGNTIHLLVKLDNPTNGTREMQMEEGASTASIVTCLHMLMELEDFSNNFFTQIGKVRIHGLESRCTQDGIRVSGTAMRGVQKNFIIPATHWLSASAIQSEIALLEPHLDVLHELAKQEAEALRTAAIASGLTAIMQHPTMVTIDGVHIDTARQSFHVSGQFTDTDKIQRILGVLKSTHTSQPAAPEFSAALAPTQ